VVDGYHGATGVAKLNIGLGAPPQITAGPSNQFAAPGGRATFSVAAVGTTNFSYQWLFDSSGLAGATNSTLTLAIVQSNNVGSYSVVVSNVVEVVTSTPAALALQLGALITNGPASQSVSLEQTAIFTVAAVGVAPLAYQWSDDGTNIAGATNSTLTLANVQTSANGSYTVVVSNALDVVTSAPAVLTVQTGPAVLTPPASQTVALGKTADFSVIASGTPPLSYQWQFDGANIAKASHSTLAVAAVKAANAGSYTVVISDSQGSVTSAPAILTLTETTKPTLAVTYPAATLTTNNASVTVRGTAGDTLGVTNVEVTVNGVAGSATGTNTWTRVITLVPGTNHLSVQSFNEAGLASTAITRTIIYNVSWPLTLLTNIAGGKITGQANGAELQIGKGYTVTATPLSSFLFSNWTGGTNGNSLNVLTNTPALAFTMITNLILQANFVTNPFPAVAGTYNGLFYPTNASELSETNAGFLTLTLAAAKGAYTASLSLAGTAHPFTGQFALSGTNQAVVSGPNKEAVTVDLQIDLNTNPPASQITGTVSAGGWQAALAANKTVFSATNKATAYAARYTMIIPPGPGAPAGSPGGFGVANITNTPAGQATLTGTLGDGTAFNQSVPIAQSGAIPVYKSLYAGKGLLLGWITFSHDPSNTPAQTLTGSLNWIKPEVGGNGLYPGGFTVLTNEILGSYYAIPGAGGSVLPGLTNGLLIIAEPDTTNLLTYTNVTLAGDKLSYNTNASATNKISATLTPGTGLMTLSFRPTGAKASVTAQGAVLPAADTNAAGWFPATNQSGFFILLP
jgi:hypothetical protein